MTAPKRYPAGVATYPGDVVHIVGEIKGPATFGGLAVATAATYDAATDATRVTFHTCGPDEPAERHADGTVRLVETATS